ncbi:MAG: GNAT family N-acetyltransferase [Pseudolabrys sp.]|nr:GNAT family N-acetyltransferase [Pseudolabrys sp.]
MSNNVRNNARAHRFELPVEGHTAFSEYRLSGGVYTVMHTEVPKELGGKGIGSQLAAGLLDLIRAEGAKVKPLCPFVRGYIEKHPDYADLLA